VTAFAYQAAPGAPNQWTAQKVSEGRLTTNEARVQLSGVGGHCHFGVRIEADRHSGQR
jgi:hypothetical protein